MANKKQKDLPEFNLDNIQEKVTGLLNQPVNIISYSRGREVISKGKIVAAYKNLFVFEREKNGETFQKTYAYSDLIAGNILLQEEK